MNAAGEAKSATIADLTGDNRLPVLALEIRKAHADVHEAAKTAAQRAIDAGRALIEAKELLKHGQWLPWLREHCALSERTAQLYMRIAASGATPEIVANLGLQATAKAIILEFPDPFADMPEPELQEWRLFVLHLMRLGYTNDSACGFMQWMQRTGWRSPTEYHGEEGDRLRKVWGMAPLQAEMKAKWYVFLAENLARSADDINDEVGRLTEAQSAAPPAKKHRRRA